MAKTKVGWRAGAALAGVAWVLAACSGEDAIVGSRGGTGGDADSDNRSTPPVATPGPSVNYWITSVGADLPSDGDGPVRCLPRELPLSNDGQVSCKIFSVSTNTTCSCGSAGRAPSSPGVRRAVLGAARERELCDGAARPACDDMCVCELTAASGAGLAACLSGATDAGWCYVAPDRGLGDPSLTSRCSAGGPRAVIHGIAVAADESAFLACADAKSALPRDLPLGTSCVPTEEFDPTFSGFSSNEVTIDMRSASCASGVCVIQGFQGRVSCPMGSSEEAQTCRLPGTSDPVTVAVPAQLIDRPPSVASTCSCRCAGPDDGPFCECGAGQICRELVSELGLPGDLAAGSYCVPDVPVTSSPTTCADNPDACRGDRDL